MQSFLALSLYALALLFPPKRSSHTHAFFADIVPPGRRRLARYELLEQDIDAVHPKLTHLAHGELAVLLRQPEVRGLLRGA